MLSGSAILRVLLLIVAAAGLAWIVQSLWLHVPEAGDVAPATGTATSGRPAERAAASPPPEPVRVVRPAEPVREPARSAAEAPPPPASAPPAEPTPSPAPAPVAQTPPPPAPDPVAEAEENAPAAAIALVDLNTASLADLNGLKGGGAIGRTIIQHRPYASIDQLLSRRVLNRATYQRIKDQVTVR